MVFVDYAAVFFCHTLALGFGMKDREAFRGSIEKASGVEKSFSYLINICLEFYVCREFSNVVDNCNKGVEN